MIWIKTAKYLEEYKMSVKFNDGKEGIIDLKNVILKDKRMIFRNLKNIDKFKKFRVDMDTIVWDNGLDLAPEFLYDLCKPLKN